MLRFTLFISSFFIVFYVAAQNFSWVKAIEGSGGDYANSTFVDDSGNIYTAGTIYGIADLDPGPGTFTYNSSGRRSCFVSKLDRNGNFIWAKVVEASGVGLSKGISVDGNGNVIFTGNFRDTVDFDPGPGVFNLITSNTINGFVVSLNSNGDFLWAKKVSSTSTLAGINVVTLPNRDIIVTGTFQGTADFDPGPGVHSLSHMGSYDIFILKLNSAGDFQWVKAIQGAGMEFLNTTKVDGNGNILLAGSFQQNADFDPGPGFAILASSGTIGNWQLNGFVCKLDSIGNYIWARNYEADKESVCESLTFDSQGNVYVIGHFEGTLDLNPSFLQQNVFSNGFWSDMFLSKLDAQGNYIWGHRFGANYRFGLQNTIGKSIETGVNGDIFISGEFEDSLQLGIGTNVSTLYATANSSNKDIFIAKLNSGADLQWSVNIGGNNIDLTNAMCVDKFDNVYTVGSFRTTANFYNWGGGYTIPVTGQNDQAFIHKINDCSNSTASINVSACYEYLSPSGNNLYTSSGVYQDVIRNQASCDSIITINLTITARDTIYPTVCETFQSPSGKYIYSTTGIYIDTVNNMTGCDSLYVIDFKVLNTSSEQFITSCDSFVSPSGYFTYYTSGVYYDTLTNSSNCDSLLKINLSINYTKIGADTVTICNRFVSPSQKYIWTQSGVYTDTLLINGCDSITTYLLIITNSDTVNLQVNACDSLISPSGKYTWRTSGIYNDTLSNQFNCDSIIIIDLQINNSYYNLQSVSICQGDSSLIFGTYRSVSGIYYDSLLTSMGCDSVNSIDLTIHPTYSTQQNLSICQGDSILVHGNYLKSSNVYIDTLTSAESCDSIVMTNLTVNPSYNITLHDTICDGDSLLINGVYHKNQGVYTSMLSTTSACDSTVITHLFVHPSYHFSNSQTICQGDSLLIFGIYQRTTGNYINALQTTNGCDSIYTFDLIVESFDTTISNNSPTLTANEANARYQWLDCGQNYAKLIGDTLRNFTSLQNGSYAVEITTNNCVDTSQCVQILNVGLVEQAIHSNFILYPNPTKENVFIQFDNNNFLNEILLIYNIKGELVFSRRIVEQNQKIYIEALSSGVYNIKLKGIVKKLILISD